MRYEFPGKQRLGAVTELEELKGIWGTRRRVGREEARKGLLGNDNKNELSHLLYTGSTGELGWILKVQMAPSKAELDYSGHAWQGMSLPV